MMFPKGLHGFDKPTILLSKGEASTWEECGVRDPAILMDTDGNPVLIDGKMVMYYTGSRDKCSIQSTGCAFSSDKGETWFKYENNPILSPISNSWESKITSTPWAIKLDDGRICMYYRGSTGYPGGADSIGLAISRDGVSFERYETNPIITSKLFQDIADENPVMGVINCVILKNGNLILTFESKSIKYGCVQIYGAESSDGILWKALNDGYPFFSADNIGVWSVEKVANPRLTVFDDGLLLGYNAHLRNGHYAIGFSFTRDLKKWTDYPYSPILVPTMLDKNSSFSGRLEGPVVLYENSLKKRVKEIIFMSIPTRAYSHTGAVIASVKPSKNSDCLPYFIKSDCLSDIEYEETEDGWIVLSTSKKAIFYTVFDVKIVIQMKFDVAFVEIYLVDEICSDGKKLNFNFRGDYLERNCEKGEILKIVMNKGNIKLKSRVVNP